MAGQPPGGPPKGRMTPRTAAQKHEKWLYGMTSLAPAGNQWEAVMELIKGSIHVLYHGQDIVSRITNLSWNSNKPTVTISMDNGVVFRSREVEIWQDGRRLFRGQEA